MTAAVITSSDDSRSIKRELVRSLRRRRVQAFLLVAPLLLFIMLMFVYPIGGMLVRSVYSPDFARAMPATAAVIGDWPGGGTPPEAVWAAVAGDLLALQQRNEAGPVAAALNVEMSGARSLVLKTARNTTKLAAPYQEAMTALDPQWKEPRIWQAIKRLSSPVTGRFYLAAVDMKVDDTGAIVSQPEDRQIYRSLFLRTLLISGLVTLCCLVLGYPVAHLLANLPLRISNILMIFVLLPFWTSLLVRTTAWIVLLQKQGVINSLLVWSHVLTDETRAELIFNSTGTIVAMTHILLPFMILPLYSVMKTVSPVYMKAARSLGANQFVAFTKVYVPQTFAGVAAGCLLVFILAVGYYITPALVGGESGTLISNMIAYHIQKSLNWGLAAALGAILLIAILALYWTFNRLTKIDIIGLG
jgi:putative spermidine/putrescine transport system permease protein